MIIWGYEANQGKHQKRSKSGKINHSIKSSKFSEEELRRVDSKVSELYEQNDDIFLTDLVDYFDKDKMKYRISGSRNRVGRPPNYSGGLPISKHKLYVIIDYMENNLKTLKRIEGVGQTKTKLVPIKLSDQIRKRGTVAHIELSYLFAKVEKLKKKSELTREDIRELLMLENEVMKFPIRMEHALTAKKRYELFEEAHRGSNNLLKEIEEIKKKCTKSVLDSMSKLIKYSSLYCLLVDNNKISNIDMGMKVKLQRRTIEAGLGS